MVLPFEESHHALHVVRVRIGDNVELFDGRGHVMSGKVTGMSRREVSLAVETVRDVPPPDHRIVIVQGWLNRDKPIDRLVNMATALGVAQLRFFRAGHSDRRPQVTGKLKRVAVESCKQSGRAWLPVFKTSACLADALDDAPKPRLIATKDIQPVPIRKTLQTRPAAVSVIVGPEGDFTEDELRQALGLGATPTTLGDTTYRAETAATLLTAIALYELGELGQ